MRNVILQEFVSLDGLAAGPNGSVDFVPASTQGDHSFGERQMGFMDSIDTILLGRVTYQMFAGHWPNVTAECEVAKLKQSAGKDMVIWGSISLAQSLITAGLIDQ
jgi:dihydrofolate reductase